MIVLALDPGIGCTGYAFVQAAHPEPRLLEAGTIRPEGDGWARCASIARQIQELLRHGRGGHKAEAVVIETPFARPRGGPKAQRSTMTLPMYGGAVGAAIVAADVMGYTPDLVPVDTWAVGIRGKTAADPYKSKRVQMASYAFNVPADQFGPKTHAGDVADAALLGRWWLSRNQR